MAASQRLGLNLQPVGENINTWGGNLNDQGLALIDEAVAGVETISLAGSIALTNTNFTSNQARNAVLIFTAGPGLSAAPTVTVPATEKPWLVINATGFAVSFSCGGSPVALPVGRTGILVCDGSALRLFEPVSAAAAATAGSAAAAAQSASDAAASAGSASGFAGTAATSAGQAMGFRNAASGSADKAQQWANNAEDSPVEPGLFSAFHWSQKSAAQAGAASGSASAAASSATAAAQSAASAAAPSATRIYDNTLHYGS